MTCQEMLIEDKAFYEQWLNASVKERTNINLTAKYHANGVLDFSDRINSKIFYDVPELELYNKDLTEEDLNLLDDVIRVDANDPELEKFVVELLENLERNQETCTYAYLQNAVEKRIEIGTVERNPGLVNIGNITCGTMRHRSILFKYLCDTMVQKLSSHTLCYLVRGKKDGEISTWNYIKKHCGQYAVIDFTNSPAEEITDANEILAHYEGKTRARIIIETDARKNGKVTFISANGIIREVVHNSKTYIIKEIPKEQYREEVIASILDHPCVMTLLESFPTEDQSIALLMNKMDYNLEQFYKIDNKRYEWDQIVILLDLARGINYLHNNHIFHRDIKPKNCLVKLDSETNRIQEVRVSDFGQGTFSNNLRSVTVECGTFGYIAPEIRNQFGRKSRVHINQDKCDVYSFGITVAEVLTRSRDFPDKVDPMALKSETNKKLATLFKKCIHVSPYRRPDFGYIIRYLENVLRVALGYEEKILEESSPYSNEAYMEFYSRLDNGILDKNEIESICNGFGLKQVSIRGRTALLDFDTPDNAARGIIALNSHSICDHRVIACICRPVTSYFNIEFKKLENGNMCYEHHISGYAPICIEISKPKKMIFVELDEMQMKLWKKCSEPQFDSFQQSASIKTNLYIEENELIVYECEDIAELDDVRHFFFDQFEMWFGIRLPVASKHEQDIMAKLRDLNQLLEVTMSYDSEDNRMANFDILIFGKKNVLLVSAILREYL
jgi:serine/threonine protein kinase